MKVNITKREFIFKPGQEGYRSVHASTVVIHRGVLHAAWFGGTGESKPDVRIWTAQRTELGWSTPIAVTPDDGVAHWNPVLCSDGETLTLFYKTGTSPRTWRTMVTRSADGLDWSEPVELVPGDDFPRGPVKNKAVRLSNGDLLAPDSVEDTEKRWQIYADILPAGSGEWQLSEPIAFYIGDRLVRLKEELDYDSDGLIQPSAWEDPAVPGRVYMLARSAFGFVYRTVSHDFGRTWEPARPTSMPNNNSGLDCVLTETGEVVLCCNPVGQNWGKRTPLSLFCSVDSGDTWEKLCDLETAPDGEFSYPAIIAEGNRLHVTYTHYRKTIAYVELEYTHEQ